MKNIFSIFAIILTVLSCAEPKNEFVITESESIDNRVELTTAQLSNTTIKTDSLRSSSLPTVIQLNGSIEVPPQNIYTITSPLGGYLRSTSLRPGMKVTKGQILATIEDQQFIQLQEDFLLAKASLQFAELDYQRQKSLNASNASSDKVTQQAQLEVNNLKIRISALTEKLSLIGINTSTLTNGNITKQVTIKSPINGFVSQMNANIGRYLSPYDVVFELIDPSILQLKVNVFEKDLQYVTVGKSISAYTIVNPTRKYSLKVSYINYQIGSNGNAEIYCKIDKNHPELVAGAYMNAEVVVNAKSAYTLPEVAIVHYEGKDYVFIAELKDAFVMTEIIAGENRNGSVELRSADALIGKSIVTIGAYTLLMKLKNVEE